MRRLIGRWNRARGVWETDAMDLLSEHSEPFSATWPSSGTTRSGVAYELPMPALPTAGTASSSSPVLATPLTTSADGVQTLERQIGGRGALLKTPTAQLAENGGSQHPDKRRAGGHGPTLADEVEHLLPTPVAHDSGGTPENHLRKKPGRSVVTSLQVLVDYDLIATGGRIAPPLSGGSGSLDE